MHCTPSLYQLGKDIFPTLCERFAVEVPLWGSFHTYLNLRQVRQNPALSNHCFSFLNLCSELFLRTEDSRGVPWKAKSKWLVTPHIHPVLLHTPQAQQNPSLSMKALNWSDRGINFWFSNQKRGNLEGCNNYKNVSYSKSGSLLAYLHAGTFYE